MHSPTFRGDSWNRTLIINAQRMIFGGDVRHLKYLKGWHSVIPGRPLLRRLSRHSDCLPARSAQSRARYPVTVRGRSPEDGLEPVDAQPEAILEISVARMVDAFERDHAVIPVRAQRIRHRLELVGELTFAQSADLQSGARGVDLHILDVDVAEIAVLHRIVTVRPGRFVTPAVVR